MAIGTKNYKTTRKEINEDVMKRNNQINWKIN